MELKVCKTQGDVVPLQLLLLMETDLKAWS